MFSEAARQPLVLVVDDEAATREMIGDYLAMHGFRTRLLAGGAALREALPEERPALVVLDLNMPGEDGLSLLRFLKDEGRLPVVMLTATASLVDRVVGLELGADDYLAKPCELRELVARIRSVLRRVSTGPEPAPEGRSAAAPAREVRFGTKWLDLDAQQLRDGEGLRFPLVASEFALLKAFAENPRRVMSRERLLDLASGRDSDPFDRSIDVRVTRIRKKVEPDPLHPSVIRTVRGAGYMFEPDD